MRGISLFYECACVLWMVFCCLKFTSYFIEGSSLWMSQTEKSFS